MAITVNNVLFVYRMGDADSIEVSAHYMNERGIPGAQVIPITCSNVEILPDYNTFRTEVEDQVLAAIAGFLTVDIYVIILGYNVPGGFYDGNDVISSVSRMMRAGHTYSKQERNYLFKHKTGTLYEASDVNYGYIVSRIDAPTVDDAKNIIDRSTNLIRQRYVNGELYIDPYFDIGSSGYNDYRNTLLQFAAGTASKMNMPLRMTVFQDPYSESVFPYLENDSFYWGGLSDYATSSWFEDTSATRVFFYNADADPAFTMKTFGGTDWVPEAIQNGYCSAAGSMSLESPNNFLDPDAFFATLSNEGTLGEAFLFSLPSLNSQLTLIGDPLITMKFPESSRKVDRIDNIFCSYFEGTEAPYMIKIAIGGIVISDHCFTEPITNDRIKLVSINSDINKIHYLISTGDCTWSKIIPNAITVMRWFDPISELNPCDVLPSGAEGSIISYDIVIIATISKPSPSSGAYTYSVNIEDANGYISLFSGNVEYVIGDELQGLIVFNNYDGVSIDTSQLIMGKKGDLNNRRIYYINDYGSMIHSQNITLQQEIPSINESYAWNQSSINLSKAIAYFTNKTEETEAIRNRIVMSTDIPTEVDLLDLSQNLLLQNTEEIKKSVFTKAVNALFSYAKKRFVNEFLDETQIDRDEITMNEFLAMTGYKISRQLLDVSSLEEDINRMHLYDEGWWPYEIQITDYRYNTNLYHFELDVAIDSNFSTIVLSFDSSDNASGWYYQKMEDKYGNTVYEALPDEGIRIMDMGGDKMIKYTSINGFLDENSEYLNRGEIYYFRFRQKTQTMTYPYTTSSDVIWT